MRKFRRRNLDKNPYKVILRIVDHSPYGNRYRIEADDIARKIIETVNDGMDGVGYIKGSPRILKFQPKSTSEFFTINRAAMAFKKEGKESFEIDTRIFVTEIRFDMVLYNKKSAYAVLVGLEEMEEALETFCVDPVSIEFSVQKTVDYLTDDQERELIGYILGHEEDDEGGN